MAEKMRLGNKRILRIAKFKLQALSLAVLVKVLEDIEG